MPPHTGSYPATVTAAVADITDHTNSAPTVEKIGRGKWRLTLTSDRVHVTVRFKTYFHGGRTRKVHSTITVDGQRHTSFCCGTCLSDLLRRTSPDATPATPEPMTNPGSLDDAPPVVRQWYTAMSHAVAKSDEEATVQLGNPSDNRWVLGLDFPKGSLRFYFRRLGRNQRNRGTWRWGMDSNKPIQLIIDDLDRTNDIKGDMGRALELLAGSAPDTTPESPRSLGRTADAQRTNSVMVRRSTVIRV